MMSYHIELPHKGNIDQVIHIFAYMRKHHNDEMIFYPIDTVVDEEKYELKYWTSSEFGHL